MDQAAPISRLGKASTEDSSQNLRITIFCLRSIDAGTGSWPGERRDERNPSRLPSTLFLKPDGKSFP